MTNIIEILMQQAANVASSNPWVSGGCFAGATLLFLFEAWRRKRKGKKK